MKHMEYDVVAVDSVNKTITFSDSEGKVATQVVNYTDSDITVNSGVTIISTAEFGNIEIEGDELSYTINLIKQTSVSKVSYEGVDT